jgi:hypothetical protein
VDNGFLVNESFLKEVFSEYGPVADVAVKKHDFSDVSLVLQQMLYDNWSYLFFTS